MERKIKVLLVEPNKLPREITISNTLKDKQKCVNGRIEYFYMEDYKDVVFICNEESKLNGMKPNRDMKYDIIFGPFLIVGDDKNIGEDMSLKKEQIEKYMKIFDKKSIEKTNDKIIAIKMQKYEELGL